MVDDQRPEDRRQLDDLLGAVLPFAHRMLEKHGEFFPFGATMDQKGGVALAAVDLGQERPLSQEVIDELWRRFISNRQSYRAVAVCFDVRVRPNPAGEPADAVAVALEHQTGPAVMVYEPYAKKGGIKYGSVFATARDRQVFT